MTDAGDRPLLLHVGSGDKRLDGWVNIDLQPLPGVDVVADVTEGLDFEGAEAVFAEHFLEHLALPDALDFLREVHRVLAPGGWLRLSTPNLDWVWSTHYRVGPDAPADEKRRMALHLNRAFRGWGHRFLWNREMLEEAVAASGFESLRWCRHGESELPVFQGAERHQRYEDLPDLPHVIIVEARKGTPEGHRERARRRRRLAALERLVADEFLEHIAGRPGEG